MGKPCDQQFIPITRQGSTDLAPQRARWHGWNGFWQRTNRSLEDHISHPRQKWHQRPLSWNASKRDQMVSAATTESCWPATASTTIQEEADFVAAMNRAHALQHPVEFGPSSGSIQQELVRLGTQKDSSRLSRSFDLLRTQTGSRGLLLGPASLRQLHTCLGPTTIAGSRLASASEYRRHRTLEVEDRLPIIRCPNRMTPQEQQGIAIEWVKINNLLQNPRPNRRRLRQRDSGGKTKNFFLQFRIDLILVGLNGRQQPLD